MAYMHVYNVIALDGWEVWALCLDWCLFPSIYPSSHPTIHLTQHGYPSNSAVCFIYTHYQRLFINFRVCVPVNALCVCVVSRMPPIRPASTVEIEVIADTRSRMEKRVSQVDFPHSCWVTRLSLLQLLCKRCMLLVCFYVQRLLSCPNNAVTYIFRVRVYISPKCI